MKAWIPLTLVFALGSAAHAQATCTYPRAPDAMPDGDTATKEQMIAGEERLQSLQHRDERVPGLHQARDRRGGAEGYRRSCRRKRRRRPIEQREDAGAEEQCGGRRTAGEGRQIQRTVEGLQGQARGHHERERGGPRSAAHFPELCRLVRSSPRVWPKRPSTLG